MSTHSLWALCLSSFAEINGWSDATEKLAPDADDEILGRVFQANERDFLFLLSAPSDGNVRIVRGVLPATLETQGVTSMIDILGRQEEWAWLADEWAVNTPSIMMHSATGALGFVLDLSVDEAIQDEKQCLQVLRDWLAACDAEAAKLGISESAEEDA